jgi:TonB family protein
MGKESRQERRLTPLLIAIAIILLVFFFGMLFFTPVLRPSLERGWKALTRESRRLLGWEKGEMSPEERRIRDEVIRKKIEEANAAKDWRSLAPEYPQPKKLEPITEGERIKALKDSPEFKEMEKALIDYLKKGEDLVSPEPPIPSLKEATDLTRMKDKGTEKIIGGLLNTKEKPSLAKPLEENLELGIKGSLAARKILERPNLPPVKVKVEGEIELTFWVLPNGIVDRAIPSVKGDTELERIAIQYLKQWRFAPLPKDQPQVEEWGVIPIKFRLQ